MKNLLVIFVLISSLAPIYSQADSSNLFGVSVYLGCTFHGELDRSIKDPTNLSSVDSRVVFNSGIDIRLTPIKLERFRIFTNAKLGIFQVKVSNPTASLGDNGIAYNHFFSYVDVGVGLILNVNSKSNIYMNPNVQRIVLGGSTTRPTTSYGLSLGYERKINKLKIGLEYYQRLYFTGFNREISRVMLRVGF